MGMFFSANVNYSSFFYRNQYIIQNITKKIVSGQLNISEVLYFLKL